MADRNVTLRRNIEQAKHCVEEALSIVERGEDARCASDDVDQAIQLLREVVVPGLKSLATIQKAIDGDK